MAFLDPWADPLDARSPVPRVEFDWAPAESIRRFVSAKTERSIFSVSRGGLHRTKLVPPGDYRVVTVSSGRETQTVVRVDLGAAAVVYP